MGINKQYILFDMDGTLTDSKQGILKSMQYAVKHFGIEVKDAELDAYSFFIGPPLRDGFRRFREIKEEDIETAVKKYREYYVPHGMFDNQIYEGIEHLLKSLKERGKTVILATSKNELFAKQILEHFGILKYFDFTVGAELDGSRSDKAEIILACLERIGLDKKPLTVMVGDRNHDITGAAKNNIESVGVLYGYGSFEELAQGEYKADYIVKTVGELTDLLL